jgi:hypothetical protein
MELFAVFDPSSKEVKTLRYLETVIDLPHIERFRAYEQHLVHMERALWSELEDATKRIVKRFNDRHLDELHSCLELGAAWPESSQHIEIAFPEGHNFDERGIRERHAAEAIRAADHVQIIRVPQGEGSSRELVLVAKRVHPKGPHSRKAPFIVLIQGERTSGRLDVRSVWRLPESIPAFKDALARVKSDPQSFSLLDLLRAFVTEFGSEIHLPNRRPMKFIENEMIPLGGRRLEDVIKMPARDNQNSFAIRISRLGVLHIILGYSIAMDRYRKALEG